MKITIKPEYERIVPPLSTTEFDKLKNDIRQNGLHYPIIINGDGIIIDGHHRFKACQELGINCSYTTKHFKDDLEEKERVILVNLIRRHLTVPQKTILIIEIEKIESERIKRKESLRKKGLLSPIGESPKKPEHAEKIALEKTGNILSQRLYERAKTVLKDGDIKTKNDFLNNKITTDKAYNIIKHNKRRADAREEAKNRNWDKYMGNDHFALWEGDILEMGKEIEDNSIDLIFTDPPYLGETIHLYDALGEIAVRVLKPGGSLVTIVGHPYIFDVHKMIKDARYWDEKKESSPFLEYQWLIVLRHGGHARRVHAFNVWAHYKPILWYFKANTGQKPIVYHDVMDLVESKPVDKDLHEWEQSTIEAENIIKCLTVENQVVLDPFMGSGTTGVAALRLGRKFKGIEIDAQTMNIANKRLHDACQVLGKDL